MSPHVGNFVQDLVEMAKATEELPVVRQQLADAEKRLSAARDHITNLELSLLNRKDEIDGLHESLRQMEVQRDNAEGMFLDATDRTEKALAFVRSVFGNAGSLIQALEPPKPEPVAPPAPPVPEAVAVQSTEPVSGVTEWSGSPAPGDTGWIDDKTGEHVALDGTRTPGQREPDPTANSPYGSQSPTVPSHDVETKADVAPRTTDEGVGVSQDPTAAPTPISGDMPVATPDASIAPSGSTEPVGAYHGKLYVYVPGWMSRQDWLEGGGTNETYDWREGMDLPFGFFRDYPNRPTYRHRAA